MRQFDWLGPVSTKTLFFSLLTRKAVFNFPSFLSEISRSRGWERTHTPQMPLKLRRNDRVGTKKKNFFFLIRVMTILYYLILFIIYRTSICILQLHHVYKPKLHTCCLSVSFSTYSLYSDLWWLGMETDYSKDAHSRWKIKWRRQELTTKHK